MEWRGGTDDADESRERRQQTAYPDKLSAKSQREADLAPEHGGSHKRTREAQKAFLTCIRKTSFSPRLPSTSSRSKVSTRSHWEGSVESRRAKKGLTATSRVQAKRWSTMLCSSGPVWLKSGHCGQECQCIKLLRRTRSTHGVDLEKRDLEPVVDQQIDAKDLESVRKNLHEHSQQQ